MLGPSEFVVHLKGRCVCILVGVGSIVSVSGDRLAVEMCEAFLQFNISALSSILV